MTARTSHDLEVKVIESYKSGDSVDLIFRKFGVQQPVVHRILRRNGVPRTRAHRFDDDSLLKAVLMYEAGETARHIELVTGISDSCVLKYARVLGVPIAEKRKRHRLTPERKRALADEYVAGDTMAALGTRYGVSAMTVLKVLRALGIRTRTGWGKYKTAPWVDRRGRSWVFKSDWELRYARWMDRVGFDWDYEPRKWPLKQCRVYTPDFVVVVDGEKWVVEVKGWLDERTVNRMREFVETYPGVRGDVSGSSSGARRSARVGAHGVGRAKVCAASDV